MPETHLDVLMKILQLLTIAALLPVFHAAVIDLVDDVRNLDALPGISSSFNGEFICAYLRSVIRTAMLWPSSPPFVTMIHVVVIIITHTVARHVCSNTSTCFPSS